LLAKAEAWLAGQTAATPPSAAPWPRLPIPGLEGASLLDVALAYRQQGWSVVPQLPGQKKPAVKWKPFQTNLPTEADLRRWFRQWPNAGLAVVLGLVSGILVVDVDGPEAHAVLVERLGGEPVAPKAFSGSRQPSRYHLFFRCPSVPTRAKQTPWHPKLEFRGEGGIVVIPPSLHRSGHRYEWAPGQSPADLPFPEVPAEVVAALQSRPQRQPTPTVQIDGTANVDACPSTRRFLAGAYASGPRWNERLFRAACDLMGRDVPLEVAEPLLLTGAQPWDAAEETKARATIQSAYGQVRAPGRC
jgi:hypothetical protein